MASKPEEASSAAADFQPIRDQLAIDRTILANERTMLAYTRTALTMLIVSVAFIELIEAHIVVAIGIAMIPLAIIVLLVGLRRYRRRRATITRLYGQTPLTAPGIPEQQAEAATEQANDAQ
jgi:putative membrane protein